VTSEHSTNSDAEHQVLPFRPRKVGSAIGGTPLRAPRAGTGGPAPPFRDLSEYERSDDSEESYRHRMMVNLAALAVIVLLSIAGAWLTTQIAQLRKDQDCLLSGRRNCAPIEVKTPQR
jgi:hypothetical protein